MADSEDLKLLQSGARDLSRCDLREANLSGMDLSGRNFRHTLLEKANCQNTNFENSDFRGAKVSFIKAQGANFDNCNLQKLHFGYSQLSNTSMRNVEGQGARFQNADLSSADMRGANFATGAMNADVKLQGIKTDATTDFDGLKVLRPTSRDPLFTAYDFVGGVLRRRQSVEELPDQILSAVASSNSSDASVETGVAPAADRVVRFDHNDPDYQQAKKAIADSIEEIRSTNEHIEGRDEAIEALSYAKSLWERVELPIMIARVGIIMAIDDALNMLKNAQVAITIAAAKAIVVDYLRKSVGL